MTEHLQAAIRNVQLLLIQEGNEAKYRWWNEQIEKVEEASKNNNKFWKRIDKLSGKKRAPMPTIKYKVNGIDKTARTDTEKVEVLTDTWKNVHTITPEENEEFDKENEEMVNRTLNRNADKITPKLEINLNYKRNENRELPFDHIEVAMTIKHMKNKAPGPSKLRKPHYSNLPINILKKIANLLNCAYAIGIYPEQF